MISGGAFGKTMSENIEETYTIHTITSKPKLTYQALPFLRRLGGPAGGSGTSSSGACGRALGLALDFAAFGAAFAAPFGAAAGLDDGSDRTGFKRVLRFRKCTVCYKTKTCKHHQTIGEGIVRSGLPQLCILHHRSG